MRVAALVPALLLTGCMLPFCGPTIYHLSGITGSAWFFDDAWSVENATAGMRAAGFEPGATTETSVHDSRGNVSMGADGGGPGRFRVYYSISTFGIQGDRAEVERAADAEIGKHQAAAAQAMADFARGAGWTLDTGIAWDKGMLHGDC